MTNAKRGRPFKEAKSAAPRRLRRLLPKPPPPTGPPAPPSAPLAPPGDFDPDTFDPTLPICDMSDMSTPTNAPLGGDAAEEGDRFTDLHFATPCNDFNLARHLEGGNQFTHFGQFEQFNQFNQFGQFDLFNQFSFPQTPMNDQYGNIGNMVSPESQLVQPTSDLGGQHLDPTTPSPARNPGQASDLISPQSQFMRATAESGDQEQEVNLDAPAPALLNPAHFDERIYDTDIVNNPFETEGPVKNVQDAGRRVRFHLDKLNHLHAIRIADNDKLSFNYFAQGNWVVESIVDYLAVLTGLRGVSGLIAEYNDNPEPITLIKIAHFLQHALIPKLRSDGPQLKGYIDTLIKDIQDPQYKHSCCTHVSNSFYLIFCGVKSSLLVIDRHRQDNPELYPADLPVFRFENMFPITRQMLLVWMLPNNDDHSLGDYDHYFMNQGPPPDQEDMLAHLDELLDDRMD